MKDLQAMDRCHRIGQRKVVSVYRIITRGTIEEKVMRYSRQYLFSMLTCLSLQKFKLGIANTVVSQQNSSLETMNTGDLLDLFSIETGEVDKQIREEQMSDTKDKPLSMKQVIESMEEMWDEAEYDEYNLENFAKFLS